MEGMTLGGSDGTGLDTRAVDGIIGYRLRRAQLQVFAGFIERFGEVGLTPAEYSVLVLVADNPGHMQSTVAAALGIKRANLVALVEGLARRELIDRRRPANDRRAHALHLTAAGEKLVARIRTLQQGFEAEIVERLGGEAERDTLMKLLQRLAD